MPSAIQIFCPCSLGMSPLPQDRQAYLQSKSLQFDQSKTILKVTWGLGGFAGKDLQDVRILTDVGDVPIQEMRDCGLDDEHLMHTITKSVKLIMDEVWC